jgi:hypothetical protein
VPAPDALRVREPVLPDPLHGYAGSLSRSCSTRPRILIFQRHGRDVGWSQSNDLGRVQNKQNGVRALRIRPRVHEHPFTSARHEPISIAPRLLRMDSSREPPPTRLHYRLLQSAISLTEESARSSIKGQKVKTRNRYFVNHPNRRGFCEVRQVNAAAEPPLR